MKVLLCSDLHLREDMPTCRKDEDWLESQRTDLENIGIIAKKNNVDDIWLLGDIFHHPMEPPKIVNMFLGEIDYWPCLPRLIAGNHDLKYHNINTIKECSVGTILDKCSNIYGIGSIAAYDFGTEAHMDADICCFHKLVFPDDSTRGLANGWIPEDLIKEHPLVKVFLMGDYHDGWEKKVNDRLFIMCGCMNIQSGKLKDYKPHVVIFDTDTYEYHLEYLPQDLAIINTEHLVEAKKRDARIESCLEAVEGMMATEFNFIENLKELKYHNNKIANIIDELLEELNV